MQKYLKLDRTFEIKSLLATNPSSLVNKMYYPLEKNKYQHMKESNDVEDSDRYRRWLSER